MELVRLPVTCGNVPAEAGIPSDINVDGVGGLVALLFGENGFLFQERGQEFVRILQRAQSQNARGVDFVETETSLFRLESPEKESSSRFPICVWTSVGRASNSADGGHGVDVGAIGQLDRGVLRLHPIEFSRSPSLTVRRSCRAKLRCGLADNRY